MSVSDTVSLDRVARLATRVLNASYASIVVTGEWPSARQIAPGVPGLSRGQDRIGQDRIGQDPVGRLVLQQVIKSGRAMLVGDARRDPRIIAGAALAGLAWAGRPIHDQDGAVVGALCVADRLPRSWSPADMAALETLALLASAKVSLRTALALAAERGVLARALAQSLRPAPPRGIPGLQVAVRYMTGTAGVDVIGDFYDVFPSVRGSWGVVVGDVCGKGVTAAASAVLARHTLRAEARRRTRPSLILSALNQALLNGPADAPPFLTAIYATVWQASGGATVQISAAGHPLALLRRADGRVRELGRPGTLLGLLPAPELRDSRGLLRPGDSLILFTDGVTEARSPVRRDLFGEDRLRSLVAGAGNRPAGAMAAAIQQAALAFAGGFAGDDAVVLVLQVPADLGPPPPRARGSLSPRPGTRQGSRIRRSSSAVARGPVACSRRTPRRGSGRPRPASDQRRAQPGPRGGRDGEHLSDVGVDRLLACGGRDGHPVVPIDHEVQPADPVHLDRRDGLPAPPGQGQSLPARPDPVGGGPEPGIEVTPCVDRADDRVQPDDLQAEPPLAAPAERGEYVVQCHQAARAARPAADPSGQAGHDVPPPGAQEVILRIHPGEPGVAAQHRSASSGQRGTLVPGPGRAAADRLDPVQHHIDDLAGKPVVQRGMTVQQAVVKRAIEQVKRHLDLGVRGDLAALDGAAEDGAGLFPPRLDHALPVFGGEGRVGLRLSDQRGDHPPVGAAAGQPGPGPQQREQVAAQRAGVPGVRAGGRPPGVQRIEGECLLARPPAVDGRLADPGPLRDRIHADRGHAAVQQELGGGVQDGLAGLLAARPATGRRLADPPPGAAGPGAALRRPGPPPAAWCRSSSRSCCLFRPRSAS